MCFGCGRIFRTCYGRIAVLWRYITLLFIVIFLGPLVIWMSLGVPVIVHIGRQPNLNDPSVVGL